MGNEALDFALRLLEAGGPTAIMTLFLLLFIRGDIVSIKTVREIVDGLAKEISSLIITAVDEEISELREDIMNNKRDGNLW